MKNISRMWTLLAVFSISFIMIACDELDIKNLINEIKKFNQEEITLDPLYNVVIRNVKNESNIYISWQAPEEAEKVVIIAVPVIEKTPMKKVVISRSEYQKLGQTYVLKGLKEETEYEIKIKAKAGEKESPVKKQKVIVAKDVTAPQDRLEFARVVKIGNNITLMWEKSSVDKNNTDISRIVARVYDVTKLVKDAFFDIIIKDISKGIEYISLLNVLGEREYKVELHYIDAYDNKVSVVIGENFVPSKLKEAIQSIQISKQVFIETVHQAIEPITIIKEPPEATGTFSISPNITQATGLRFNSQTGEITGTATKESIRQEYIISFTGDGYYEGTAITYLEVQIIYGKYKYRPSNKDELRRIIDLEIEMQGNKANLNMINTSLIKDMSKLFKFLSFQGNISRWNTSNVTNMQYMFGYSTFNRDISRWDVRKVENMQAMFFGASKFNGDISRWDVDNVQDMSYMFSHTSAFNGDISGWDVSNVKDMSKMFSHASAFNRDILDWDVSNVKDMSEMFFKATSFGGDISGWDVRKVENMKAMFTEAMNFNGDISRWDVDNVQDMSHMFSHASAFNRDISGWDVSNVQDMSYMFYAARNFNQDIERWNVLIWSKKVDMFIESGVKRKNLPTWY